jgi:F-type H+-transporting ATPase subunit delta
VAERATIARPYAKAAFEYGRDAKTLGAWSQGLTTAAAIVADPRVTALIKNPRRLAADAADLIADVAGAALDAGMRNFLQLLAQNHRLLLLGEIAAHFEALRSAVENTIDVDVTSAVALDAEQRAKLSAALAKRLGRSIRMQNSVDPTLLGGAVIRAGDTVIDGSLKGRLQRLGTALEN